MNSRRLSAVQFRAPRHSRWSGFSLVEVTMAIGIVAFAFVTMFALLPVGMTTFRKTIDLSVGSQIAQKVVSDAIQTDFDTLIDPNTNLTRKDGHIEPAHLTFRAPWRYFDDQGNELAATDKSKAVYHVLMRVSPEAPIPTVNSSDLVPYLAQVTVQVVTNPGGKTIDTIGGDPANEKEPLRNLVDPTKGFSVYTTTAMIAKNK